MCRGNQYCSLLQTQIEANITLSVGWIPQLVRQKIIRANKNRLRKCKNLSNTGQTERVSIAADTLRLEKTPPRLAQEIWVGTKVGATAAGPSYWTPNNELNVHRPSNLNKLIWNSIKITKLRLRILPTNMPTFH